MPKSPKTSNYVGALWVACRNLTGSDDVDVIGKTFESILANVTEEDVAEAYRYNRKIYKRKHRDKQREYQRTYREKEKLKILRGE